MLGKWLSKTWGSSKTEALDAMKASSSGLYVFSKKEIKKAMNSWKQPKVRIASGTGSRVFLGILPSGQLVAIKKLEDQLRRELVHREVDIHCRACHPNIVSLVGACGDGGRKLYLVYEYCSNGNLAQQLVGCNYVLSWEERVHILRGVALAMRFLHSHPDGSIVHAGVKAKNILLTEKMDPKISNFESTEVLGPQENPTSAGKKRCGVDVHGFGVVALQVLSGTAGDLNSASEDTIIEKAKEAVRDGRGPMEIKDPRLSIGPDDLFDMESILRVVVLCVSEVEEGRPTMDEVFEVVNEVWRKARARHLQNNGREGAGY